MTVDINFEIPNSTIIAGILGLVFVVNLVLAWRTYISNRKHPVNIFFTLTCLMIAFWTGTMMLAERIFMDPFLISLFIRLSYLFAALLIFFFYLFTYYFPFKIFVMRFRYSVLLFLSTCFILVVSMLPNIFISARVFPESRFAPEISLFWHFVYAAYFVALFTLAFWNLFSRYKKFDGIWKIRLRQVIIATFLAFIGGGIFSLFIPIVYNASLDWVGPIFSLFMVCYIWYNIFWKSNRHKG